MRKVTKGLLTTGIIALVIGACGDTVEVLVPDPPPPAPPPVIPPFPPPPPPPPPPPNQAPAAVGSIPAISINPGGTSTVDVAGYFSDADGDELSYDAGSSNEAAATVSMDGSSATVTGVADGTAVVTITARDPDGGAAAQSVSVTVGDGVAENRSPVAVGTIPAHDVDVGGAISIRLGAYFSDPDGDALTYAAESSNSDAATTSVEAATVTISGVADGKAVVTVTASDPDGESAEQTVSLTVGDGVAENRSPVAVGTIPAYDVDVGGAISIRLGAYFSDPDGDALTYGAESSNSDAASTSVEAATVTISGVADGKAVVTVTASDPDGESAEQTVSVTIGDGDSSNNPPVAQGSIPDHSVGVGGTVTVDVTGYFSDADGDELSYMASSSNADVATASMEGTTVTIEGVAAGQAVINVTASDGESTVAQGFSVTVEAAPANNPPVAQGSIPDHSVGVGGTVTVDVTGYFSDADGDELSYMASSSNADVATASMEGTTVTIEGVAAGQAVINVTASDGESTVAQGFSVTVEAAPVNNPPVAVSTIPGSSFEIGGTGTIDAAGYFSDADGDELTYTGSSSNEGVATVAMEGSTATITAIAAGDAVITISASDGSASVSQGFTVTVQAEPVNNPPVAVGTIPGSSLEIGGTSTIDAAGYFSDADADELTYTGSSSNEGVATVAMEGASATITAIAAGDAVITISASDGSASVSQGFRVEVNAGPKEATVVITRLLDADRQQISDPSGISGTIYVVLDVESNDETWTDIGLTLGGETVTPMCRGSASADVAVGPGLAAAGQAEIECQLTTNAVVGECVGMQLDPKYANGEYQLGAFLTTDADERRAAIAPLPISLGNHGFVMIAHVPGSQSELGAHTSGLTFYGGPNAEGNVNQFHACPVAYDGTVVGKMRLSTMHTDTSRPTPTPVEDATSLSFRESRFGPDYPSKEAPFTWSAGTQWWNPNNSLENIPGGDDASETWIVNDGQILDPNGLDATATFRAGGETAKLGPLHFDFKAPVRTNESEVVIATSNNPATWESTTATYYRDSSGGSTRRLRITEMTEMGVGHVYGTTSAIAVGDCGVAGNADTRGSTAFTPLGGLENVTLINQLPEEDPIANGVADGGGVDCYVAEVQSLADRLGNAVGLADVARIRTASTFGVDRTAPEISRERPSEALVLSSNSLFFEVEDPRLGTGEDGSGLARNVLAWAGSSNPNSGQVYWRASGTTVAANGSVEIDIDPAGNARFAREASHTVYAATPDVAGNYASTAFTFVRDQSDPVLSLSAVPNDFGSITAKSVSVGVAGTLNDATEIRRAFLSIHHGTTCTADDPLEASQVSGPVRRLDNDSNSIEFSEVFTVKQGDDNGATDYCFFLHGEDDARDADDRAAANSYSAVISTFSVNWPAGPVVKTYDLVFTGADDAALAMVSVDEGSTATYKVALSDEPTADVTVAITVAEANREVYADLSTDELTFTSDNYNTAQVVTITTLAHDDNAASETFTLSHDASDGGYDNADANLSGTVNDDEVVLIADLMSLGENDDTTMVAVSVATGVADPDPGDMSNTDRTITVTIGGTDPGQATIGTDFDLLAADKETVINGPFEIVLAQGETSKDTMLYIVPTDDAVADEEDEVIPVAGTMSGGTDLSGEVRASDLVDDDEIGLTNADPDVTITANPDLVDEDADATEVTVTVTAPDRRSVDRTFTVAVAVPSGRAATVENFTVTIGPGETIGEGKFDLTPTHNTDDDGNATVTITIDSVTPPNKANEVAYTFGEAEIEIVDDDEAGN